MRSAWVWVAAAAGVGACLRAAPEHSAPDAAPELTEAGTAEQQTEAGTAQQQTADPHVGCDAQPPHLVAPAARNALFATLTANTWSGGVCSGGGMLAPTCHRVSFKKNGSFSWVATSDVNERDDHGDWNFQAFDEQSGILFFSTGDSVLFQIRGGTLNTSRIGLAPDTDGTVATDSGSASELPTVQPPAQYSELIGTCWKKTNDFDLYRVADRLTFSRAGFFDASYRAGQCEQTGPFAVDGGQLVAWSDKGCDLRNSEYNLAPTGPVSISGDLLITLDSTYWPVSLQTDDQLFLADTWWKQKGTPFQPDGATDWGGLRVTGRFAGPLTQGEPLDIKLTLQNTAAEGIKAGQFTLTTSSVQLDTGVALDTSGVFLLASRDFDDTRFAPQQARDYPLTIVPAVPGDNVSLNLQLAFKFFDGTAFTTSVSFLTPVLAGQAVPDLQPLDGGVPAIDAGAALTPRASLSPCGVLTGASQNLYSLAISADATLIAAGADTGAIEVWQIARDNDAVTGHTLYAIAGDRAAAYDLRFSKGILASTHGNDIRLWNASDGAPLGSLEGHRQGVLTLGVSSDGELLASGSFDDGEVRIWRVSDRSLVSSFIAGSGTTFGLAFAPDGTLATGNKDWLVKLWEPISGTLLHTLDGHTDWVTSVGFTQGGNLLVSGSDDDSLIVWNVADGSLLRQITTSGDAMDMSVAPDGLIAVANSGALIAETQVSLFDIAGAGPSHVDLPVTAGGLTVAERVAFSADGTLLASAASDGQIHLWCR